MTEVLLRNGASALSKAGNGWLPVHLALRYGDKQTIQYFLDRSMKEFYAIEREVVPVLQSTVASTT